MYHPLTPLKTVSDHQVVRWASISLQGWILDSLLGQRNWMPITLGSLTEFIIGSINSGRNQLGYPKLQISHLYSQMIKMNARLALCTIQVHTTMESCRNALLLWQLSVPSCSRGQCDARFSTLHSSLSFFSFLEVYKMCCKVVRCDALPYNCHAILYGERMQNVCILAQPWVVLQCE